jgi:signal transduction histidine kinase
MAPSLQKRLSTILAVALTVLGLTSYLILRNVIAPAFNTLESSVAETDLGRAALGIDGQLQQIRTIVGDWAPWDQAYSFVSGADPDFVERNIDNTTLLNLNVDVMQFYDREGQRLWSGLIEGGSFVAPEALGRLGADDPVTAILASHPDPDSVVAGMLMTAKGPMLIVSMPMVVSAGEGPIGGTIVMGRLLTEERLQDLRDHIKVSFDIVPIGEVSATYPGLLEQFEGAPADAVVQRVDESEVRSLRLLRGISGNALGVLEAETRRNVTRLGYGAADLALLLFAGTSVLLVGFLWYLLSMHIIRPLGRLGAHMAAIRQSGELSARLALGRNDEIGRLGAEFNALTGELQQARSELVDQSFKAGRADTAAEVLHNIRNSMTPVVNVAENLSAAMNEMTALRLRQAADELASPDCENERRKDLLRYIAAAADRLRELGHQGSDDVDLLCKQARLVEHILENQEKVTRFAPPLQHVDVTGLVSESSNVLPRNAEPEIELRIGHELDGIAVAGNRVQLLQIIGNVLLNAYEAIRRSGALSGRIEVIAAEKHIENVPMVQLSIRDTGTGIDESSLPLIFQRGYSSKESAGSGLGLHWCANAVKVFGGSIRAESAGPGTGTTIHITLPAADHGVRDISSDAGRVATRP